MKNTIRNIFVLAIAMIALASVEVSAQGTFRVNNATSPAGCGSNQFTSIQAAINSAAVGAGSIIEVCPGDYTEFGNGNGDGLTVNKSVTVRGINYTATTGGNAGVGNSRVIVRSGNPGATTRAVVRITANNAVFENITVDANNTLQGNAAGGNFIFGILITGATGARVSNNTIRNLTAADAGDFGIGVFFSNSATTALGGANRTVTINNNIVTNIPFNSTAYQADGNATAGTVTTATITGNFFDGNGNRFNFQAGVTMNSAVGDVSFNRISNAGFAINLQNINFGSGGSNNVAQQLRVQGNNIYKPFIGIVGNTVTDTVIGAPATLPAGVPEAVFANNIFSTASDGINLTFAVRVEIRSNQFNLIFDTPPGQDASFSNGAVVDAYAIRTDVNSFNNTITRNTIQDSPRGIFSQNGNGNTTTSNTFINVNRHFQPNTP